MLKKRKRPLEAVLSIAAILCAGCGEKAKTEKPLIKYVNPFIGTGGNGYAQGNAVMGATVPFGMVKPGPDTFGYGTGKFGRAGFCHTAGYWYADDEIEGFSQVHFHGTGVADYGDVLMMPTIGMSPEKTVEEGYRSKFSHDTEDAEPGYYAVTLSDTGIRVELTASAHAAFHRYTFPGDGDAVVLIDLGHVLGDGRSIGSRVDISPGSREVFGWMTDAGDFVGEGGAFKVFFSAQFSAPFVSYGVWDDEKKLSDGVKAQDGKRIGAYLKFAAGKDDRVEAKVGVSYVSVEQAKLNLRVEIEELTFDEVRRAAKREWEKALSAIAVEGGAESEKTMFMTALYHSLLMPTLFTDANGRYMGIDKQEHTAGGFLYYTDFSLWDTYRTQHSLLMLAAPDRQRDMLLTLMAMLEQRGTFPRWPLAWNETGSMIGSPAHIVIAESYLKGFRDFDAEKAYAGMLKPEAGPPAECLQYSYCPADRHGGAVSLTLEYAYADFAIALLAKALGKDEDHDRFIERTKFYKNHWEPGTKFFRGRNSDGTWTHKNDFDPTAWSDDYCEGNAWQYMWLVPYDVKGLIGLFRGRDAMVGKLDEFFNLSKEAGHNYVRNIHLWDLYYWHGNEPDIHAAYMYALAGRPDKTPPWIRWIRETRYTDGPDGIEGNDDAGTLSAWYVFSAMGFYPLAGTDIYLIGSPVFRKSVIRLESGDFTVIAKNASAKNIFVRSATLNGEKLERPWFRHSDVAGGGSLVLDMGDSPSEWGMSDPLDPEAP